ncbi:hypothetical protein QWJ34_13875 [Saccharibacillus sp. CPCC 101409]|uniref:hypothetical protein n=1 Tax=Saccharibacillus sp. CPCC 101409 TaxID=3058041 RepID=UPI002673AB21|nr:hypothetical protein [Saccharibacillus sp. CPCC 101409]MDO3410856.1 hypothetical protein [Saccharibacillus sp. CPCC 101409]
MKLLIQAISLYWDKEVRGGPYAGLRKEAESFELPPAESFSFGAGSVISAGANAVYVHELSLRHNPGGLNKFRENCAGYELSAGTVFDKQEGLRFSLPEDRRELNVRFRYSPAFGRPIRTDGLSGLLDEPAFALASEQYGRIVVNGRHPRDDGSLYELRIWNIRCAEKYRKNAFTADLPERIYDKRASLYRG